MGGEKGKGVDTGRPAESKWTRKTGEGMGIVNASKGDGSGGKRDDSGQGRETTRDILGNVLRVLFRRVFGGVGAVLDSESDTLSESESDESARQEKALGLAKREMAGEKVLFVSGGKWGAVAMVTRGEDHETDGRRDLGLAARTRTRLDFCPSDLRQGKAGEACELVSS